MITSTFSLWYCSYFSIYFFPIPYSTFIPSFNCYFNLMISSFNPFSCTSNTWTSSSFHLFEFSISNLRETISASQYYLDYVAIFTNLWRSLSSYTYNLLLRLLILFKEKTSLLLRLSTSFKLSSSKPVTPFYITKVVLLSYSSSATSLFHLQIILLVGSPYEQSSFVFPSWIPYKLSLTSFAVA